MITTPELEVRVARKAVEATDICTFELVSADGRPLPAFSAGSHVDVHTPAGLTRQYSLCNDPSESHRYVLGVLKDTQGRGGSRAMHEAVHEGDVLRISAPRNHFPLAHDARHSLLLAGGIGITPILCMAERLAMTGADFELHYAARSVDRMAFRRRIEDSAFVSRSHLHFDDGPSSQALDLQAQLARARPDTHLYVCGPKGFMNAALETARARGWPESHLHYEFFSGNVPADSRDRPFEVQIASSGRVIMVAPETTVVQALAQHGISVQTSCEQGVCGTCVTRVLEGEVDHRDLFLTRQEQAANDRFTPCCSRAFSARIVLDL